MIKVEHETISFLRQIRTNLNTLESSDTPAIIQVGAGLESIAGSLPAEYVSANELLILCLGGLQAIFEGKASSFEEMISLIAGALVAVEQAIVLAPNAISDAMVSHAKEKMQAGLGLQISGADEIHAEPQAAEDEAANNESVQPSEIAESLSTLDEVASYLIPLESNDIDGIKLVFESLKKLSSASDNADVKKSLMKAAREAQKVLNGKSTDEDASLILIGNLIDEASNFADDQYQADDPELTEPIAEIQPLKLVPEPAPAEKPVLAATATNADYEPDVIAEDADLALLNEFVVESQENIEAAESALLHLETDPGNLENINTVFRAFHTVKGSAAFLGLKRLTELAHHAESLLSRIRDGEINCTGGYANLALRSVDMLKAMFASLQECLNGGRMILPPSYGELLQVLMNPEERGVTGDAEFFVDGKNENKSDVAETESQEFIGQNLTSKSRLGDILLELKKITEEQLLKAIENKRPGLLGVSLVNDGIVSVEDIEEALNIQKRLRSEAKLQDQKMQSSTSESSVRVRTDRLDRLIDMVGELVVAQSMLAQDATVMQGVHFELARKVAHGGKIVRDLQDLSMAMRMIPLKNTFSKMARVVRDVAQKCGKSVEFVTDGEDTEIDRNMVDLIADPLVHMVRNAVDHGIEMPDERTGANKSSKGKVRLSAYHAGGNVVVELRDDGKGLDSERILQKALENGLIESDKGLTEHQIFNLIFAPGMSTADKLTDVSGRGVGMDVVRRNIESMQGKIEISSEKGKGSVFTIRLPLTLAITDGMLVRVGEERFILPTVHIHLSFRPNVDSISTVTGRGEMVHLRGELMPMVRLHSLFEVEGAVENPTEGSLVIVADDKRRCALLVDELLGQHQVVAKPLGSGVGKTQGVAGGAILGDGRVGLILDTTELVALARQTTTVFDRKRLEVIKAA